MTGGNNRRIFANEVLQISKEELNFVNMFSKALLMGACQLMNVKQ
jgi:hypothetical protein